MHHRSCIRSEGDWICAGGCTHDAEEREKERQDARVAEAVAAERERCAQICDRADKSTHPSDLAAAIRSGRCG